MNELDQLRAEAEQLKNTIRVSQVWRTKQNRERLPNAIPCFIFVFEKDP